MYIACVCVDGCQMFRPFSGSGPKRFRPFPGSAHFKFGPLIFFALFSSRIALDMTQKVTVLRYRDLYELVNYIYDVKLLPVCIFLEDK